jgi:hypothetical protein
MEDVGRRRAIADGSEKYEEEAMRLNIDNICTQLSAFGVTNMKNT